MIHTVDEVWKRLFPLQVGDSVKISDSPTLKQEYRGKKAIVLEIEETCVLLIVPSLPLKPHVCVWRSDYHELTRVRGESKNGKTSER